MQKRNREVNVFSLSAIDLFCSGMGAIMVLMVILIPYYLRPEAARPFLVVTISWTTNNDDVDLHIKDPLGNEFSYQHKTYPGSEAFLEVDSTKGPATEVWVHPAADPGVYEVSYVYYSDGDRRGPVSVKGGVVQHSGRLELPLKTIATADTSVKHPVARLRVEANGEVHIE